MKPILAIVSTEFQLYLRTVRFFLILSFVVAITSLAGILVEIDDPLRLFMPQALAYYLGIFLGLSVHTLFTVSLVAISTETFNIKFNIDEFTEDLFIILEGNLTNNASLAVNLFFELTVLDNDGQSIGKNSTSLNINAGDTLPFSIKLLIPTEMIWSINLEKSMGLLEVTFNVRTLGDLVGFTNKMVIPVGGEN